ncbi:serine/threonine-protein kinase [Streptomyces sp. NPDC127197]|uniref:serine/threonine-protein kinase n=1 Tax=Streptomyces sp. NPDC127197 TaxID=3345388 RepID=UPI00363C7723
MTGAYEGGRVIAGRYRLLRRLGAGGWGRVWLAYDPELAREVALKEIILPPNLPESEVGARIARARGEAKHLARLVDHPHVVTVHDIVEEGGLPWIVMAYVPGATDLEEVVHERGPLLPTDVARIGLAILDALQEGHRLGVLHRDVKPANVLLTQPGPQSSHPAECGRVLLTDYGIALEPSSGEPRLTAPAEIIGTLRFMAPERFGGEMPTPACDLFSLGGTLYFALEGTGPFDRDSPCAMMNALQFESPAPPRRAAELAPVILGLLVKDPAQRMGGDEAAQLLTPIAAQPRPSPSQPPALPPEMPQPERPPASKPPRAQESAPPTEITLPTEPEKPTGPPLEPPPHKGDEARPRRRLPWPRSRRARLIAGVVAVALAAGGVGIYLAQSLPSDPEPPAPTSVSPIRVGDRPEGVAVSPDGRWAYVTNSGSDSVSVIDTATNRPLGNHIRVGDLPKGVVVSPEDGRRVYVTNMGSDSVSVINTETNRPLGNPIRVGDRPEGVAVSPDGSRVYVTNSGSDSVSVINTETNRPLGNPIRVGDSPKGVVVSPEDGSRVYVTNMGSDSVSVINAKTNRPLGNPIPVDSGPAGVAVSPDGSRVYVTSLDSPSVSVINTETNRRVGRPIPVDPGPAGVAVSPKDGRWVYVTSYGSAWVSVINTETNRRVGRPIPVESGPAGVTVSLDGSRVYVANFSSGSVSAITI